MIGNKMSGDDPELAKQRRTVTIFDLYDQIVRNALSMRTLLKQANISIDPTRSDEFNELLLSLHGDAVQHSITLNNLIIAADNDRRKVDRRLPNQTPTRI